MDKANAKKAGWKGYDYDEEYVREVRKKEERLERERVREERLARKKEREVETKREKEEDQRRRAYESDVVAEAEARKKRERRAEREKSRGVTDDERDNRRRKTGAVTDDEREERRRRYEERYTPSERAERKEKRREERRIKEEQKRKKRVISGPLLEEGGNDEDYEYHYMMEKRGGGGGSIKTEYSEEELARRKKVKRIAIIVLSILLALAIFIPVGVMVSKKGNKASGGGGGGDDDGASGSPSNHNLQGVDKDSIPASAKGGILDPFTWYDTVDFNVTYTDANVAGLSLMGLNSTWNDDVQANSKVPKLKDDFQYGKMPIRGINVGGWLNLEPFITPSFFNRFSTRDGVIDEWTFCKKMGPSKCKAELEKHYSSFVTRKTFEEIREAGFDHVRIPFGYWAVKTYDGDPYVSQISWRYLLRAIEYARQNGLRVNLDLHGAPGSQNGWNHSGRQGFPEWLNGPDGDLNAQRTLEIHDRMSKFFAQPRYKKVVTMYGIVNEPRMVDLDTERVLSWTQSTIDLIRENGITGILVFGDGFMGLDKWQGKLQTDDKLLLDVHQYVIFNIDQLSLPHREKLNFACKAWTQQTLRSSDRTTGFGPTICGEWSQADTDCAPYINNVGMGTRWEGTLNTGNESTSILDPMCPTKNNPECSCTEANADPADYSEAYKKWLYQFAVAQMESFEKGWGWFYWTWDTEKAVQWSWRKGMAAGILPTKTWERGWSCNQELEDFEGMGLSETY